MTRALFIPRPWLPQEAGKHTHIQGPRFLREWRVGRAAGSLLRAVPHTCAVALGCSALGAQGQQPREQPSAPPCCTRSISSLNLSHSRPRRDDRGLGHRCGNGVIRSNQASAQMAAGMREGHITPSGSSAGVDSCQGSAPACAKAGSPWANVAFLFGAFPLGTLATCHCNAFGERKRSDPSLSTTDYEGDASSALGTLRRRENHWARKR